MNEFVTNARIANTWLGYDNGIFTFKLELSGDGWGAIYGERALDEFDEFHQRRIAVTCLDIIQEVIDVVGVQSWEQLRGQYVRVRIVDNHVVEILNILKDIRFDIVDYFRQVEFNKMSKIGIEKKETVESNTPNVESDTSNESGPDCVPRAEVNSQSKTTKKKKN